ncbi:precorrin-6y C5,15-methyltransferase (decarboxylating) subunit CbiE [Hydrogenoanaerobacterium sp.]|uniref:precorrin-6y C5,15-methyltransferase (decarboxylating) subunit CbiE n=1 Tax=Hydrogenoanaerobacterium sp. TaxID=2953763 RepID=UPI002898970F|nr:precorrin-6y C5,15-methyltransferase (decarboxylating) subunit CbiE [Hydrogenoanaerobacterium sp.]
MNDKAGVGPMKIYIVGIGMGNPATLTQQAIQIIADSDCLIGAQRMLDSFCDVNAARFTSCSAEKIAVYLAKHPDYRTVSVLMSGDVGFYSGAKRLCELLAGYDVECIAGISSVQYLCAKAKTSWDDAKLISMHGREQSLVTAVRHHAKVFALTGGKYQSVTELCAEFYAAGLGEVHVCVGERLSYPDEQLTYATAQECAKREFAPLSVMLVFNDNPIPLPLTHGLPDECFLRGDAPMTKLEVRTVSISALKLCHGDTVWDVGAGTGSVCVEIARILPDGKVFAVEKNPAALGLLHQNKASFGACNLHIVEGTAPAALANLPAPDAVFIGGSSGGLSDIIAAAMQKNPQVRIVATAITLETASAAMESFKRFQLSDTNIVQLSVARSKAVGGLHMMMGQNPVTIFSGGGRSNGQ